MKILDTAVYLMLCLAVNCSAANLDAAAMTDTKYYSITGYSGFIPGFRPGVEAKCNVSNSNAAAVWATVESTQITGIGPNEDRL